MLALPPVEFEAVFCAGGAGLLKMKPMYFGSSPRKVMNTKNAANRNPNIAPD